MRTMTQIGTAQLIGLFDAMADAIEKDKDRLSELDGVIGDGDHGVTMSIGFTAVRKALSDVGADATPADVFNAAARAFLNAVGASAGPLYATAFMRAGAAVKGKDALDDTDFGAIITAMAEGIKVRGKADAGDKTMFDAWQPAGDAALVAAGNGCSAAEIVGAAHAAAERGAEATRDMTAKKGRSARLGERSLGHVDAGAASTVVLLRAMAEGLVAP